MGYVGQAPGSGGVTSSDIVDLAIVNADVNASAAIAMSKTALVGGTGLTLSTNTLAVDASQTQITAVGDLGTGSITSGFTSIDVGAGAISTTGAVATGTLTVTGNATATGAIALAAAQKLYFDGVAANGDTYIHEESADLVRHVVGGVSFIELLEGSQDTLYLNRDGADIDVVYKDTGGNAWGINGASGDMWVGAGKKIYLDGIGDTYIYEESADDLHIVAGGVSMIQLDQNLGTAANGSIGLHGQAPNAAIGLYSVSAYTISDNANYFGFNIEARSDVTTSSSGMMVGFKTKAAAAAASDNNMTAALGIRGVDAQVGTDSSSTGTITGVAPFVAEAAYENGATITNAYGYYAFEQTVATNNYSFFTPGGAIGVAGSAGTDGQVLTSGGANANAAWEDAGGGGGGITHASQFRLSSAATGSTSYAPLTNWEQVDTDGYGGITTAGSMSESSGTFTFPATGIYRIDFVAGIYQNGSNDNYFACYIMTDNASGSFGEAARGRNNLGGSGEATNTAMTFIFDVTDVSNHFVQFKISDIPSNAVINGDSGLSRTHVTFVRLGDT